MGVILEIALRFAARAVIVAGLSGLSFLGYKVGEITQKFASSTPPETKSQIVINVNDNNITPPTNENKKIPTKAVTSSETKPKSKTTKVVVKTPQTKPATTEQNNEINQQPQNVIPPKVAQPSLSNLPVPTIELPSVKEVFNNLNFGSLNSAYGAAHESVVNVFCISQKGNLITVSTGSGVNINSQGIIITNAHVAETLLLPNENCTIRTGDIAQDTYEASLVYINKNWLEKNAGVIFSEVAKGTGENDFALLAITKKINTNTKPTSVSYAVPFLNELSDSNVGEKILAAGYPGGTLGALSLRQYLAFVADGTSISNVYTFSGQTSDIIETGSTKVGQRGSSGGGIFNENGELLGLIVSTMGDGGNEDNINAITLPYINRTIKNDTGESLQEFVSTDSQSLISNFQKEIDTYSEYVKPYIR